MTPQLSLPGIAALTRAGAAKRAWDLFVQGGWLDRQHDPAALSLKGRLLKDRARIATEPQRKTLFADASAAYAMAHGLSPAPYRAINVATTALLAGDEDAAASWAKEVLQLLEGAAADTPYFLAATLAEALLILGDPVGAEAALQQAATFARDSWDDRAVTQAQLREILAARGEPANRLEWFTPPPSLHFAGHLGIASGGASEQELASTVDSLVERHRFGFAWGALAAGADIVIAERLLAAGIELHAVLPCPAEEFVAQSVAPAGAEWVARYDRLVAALASLRVASRAGTTVHDPLATAHAGQLAIGGALLTARRLGTAAYQLLVEDGAGGATNTARQGSMWPLAENTRLRLVIPRDMQVENLFPPERPDPARRLATLLTIGLALPGLGAGSAQYEAAINAAAGVIAAAGLPDGSVQAGAGRWDVILDSSTAALDLITALLRMAGPAVAIGAHAGIVTVIPDPVTGTAIAYGPEAQRAAQLMAMAPFGTALASDELAVCLAAGGQSSGRSEIYHLGDEDTGGPVHMLIAADQ